MRTVLFAISFIIVSVCAAQRPCASSDYLEQQKLQNPGLASQLSAAESFINNQYAPATKMGGEVSSNLIRIPVVVHVLYNNASQNISDEQVKSQIDALNRDFRKQNSDTANIPARFKSLAADVQIEFVLATADPNGRATSGIVRRQTAVSAWTMDDKIKSTSQGGDDAWDSKSYLNFWVGNLRSLLGYSSTLVCTADKDGIVIHFDAFGTINTNAPYNLGRTATHEVGHWLGLKHIWGDTYCGDDAVDDTPKQGNFTSGCPNSFRSSCSNGSMGDMYMNYMDFTNDACLNMFTKGQKERMLSLFGAGGVRNSFLSSKGLDQPWNHTAAITDVVVSQATNIKFYPNPSITEVVVSFSNENWIGKTIRIIDINGLVLQSVQVTSAAQKIDVSKLKSGIYFLQGATDEEKLREKLIKL
jgi:hypothetical protein